MKAPHFDLPGVDGKRHSPASARGKNGLVVLFICNHCPYVKRSIDRDETQEVARAYDAVCTPDFFGFGDDLELRYHGRLEELFQAMTGSPPHKAMNSIGCSIKWKK